METAPRIELVQLGKRYGDFEAVSSLDLSVGTGEIFALLGPNGAGKTTTIRMLMGILQPTSGTARVDGLDCFRQRADVMARVGYVPDEPVFYDYLKGIEVLRFVGEMHGLSTADAEARFRPLIEQFELDESLEEFAVNYSKGMKKKLAIACALLHAPAVLVLDEPTNGLDPLSTRVCHEIVRQQAKGGTAVFFSTHLLDQAERLCDRVGILFHGRLAAQGPLHELHERLAPGGSLEDVFFSVTGQAGTHEP